MIFERVYRLVFRISLIISLILYGLGFIFYSHLPAKIPTQFGFDGGVNSWGSKLTVFLFPTLLLCSCLLLICGVGVYLFFLYGRLLE